MFQDCYKLCEKLSMLPNSAKGDYVDPKTEVGTIIAHNPVDQLCIDFTKVDPSKDVKENVLVLTDAFTKFSQACS